MSYSLLILFLTIQIIQKFNFIVRKAKIKFLTIVIKCNFFPFFIISVLLYKKKMSLGENILFFIYMEIILSVDFLL